MQNELHSKGFLVIVAIFITSLLVANIIAVKPLELYTIVVPAGIVIFPISYICADVLTEVYGYKKARQVIWLGFLCNLIAVVAIFVAQILPAPVWWDAQSDYERILGFTPRLLVASFSAYLVGELVNSAILAKLKRLTRGKWLWLRTISSTIVGQGLDSLIFVLIAFLGTMSAVEITTAIIAQWLFKSAYEALATPLTYLVIRSLELGKESQYSQQTIV